MDEADGYVIEIQSVDGSFKISLDTSTDFVTKDICVQRVLAVALAVQQKVKLHVDGKKILRVERADPISDNASPPVKGPKGKITGVATQIDQGTKQSYLEVFFKVDEVETQYQTSNLAIQALCETACIKREYFVLVAKDNIIVEAILERP